MTVTLTLILTLTRTNSIILTLIASRPTQRLTALSLHSSSHLRHSSSTSISVLQRIRGVHDCALGGPNRRTKNCPFFLGGAPSKSTFYLLTYLLTNNTITIILILSWGTQPYIGLPLSRNAGTKRRITKRLGYEKSSTVYCRLQAADNVRIERSQNWLRMEIISHMNSQCLIDRRPSHLERAFFCENYI